MLRSKFGRLRSTPASTSDVVCGEVFALSNTTEGKSKKRILMVLAIVGLVLVMEAATVFVVIWMTESASAGAANAAEPAADVQAGEHVQWVEMPLLAEKFQNSRTGVSYIFDTEIFILVRESDQTMLQTRIEAEQAQLCRDIGTIFRRAEPHHLNEGELRTITRQIETAVNKQLGTNPDSGEPYVREVIIKKCMRFRSDL